MKTKFKLCLISVITTVLILIAGLTYANINPNSIKNNEPLNSVSNEREQLFSSSNSLNISFNEISMTDDDLIKSSDLVIKGNLLNVKERGISPTKNKTKNKIATSNEVSEPAEVEIPYVIYKFKINENLSDSKSKLETINLVMVDANLGTGNPDELLKDGEYVLFLRKNSNDTYNLVSYSQGLRKVKDDKKELVSIGSNEVSKYDDLKAKVKENNKK